MRIEKASTQILTDVNGMDILKIIEKSARTCYLSHNKITEDGESAEKLIKNLIARGHEAMLEFADVIVCFTVDRGVTHEIVRHRLASYAMESTRYCNYSRDDDVYGSEIKVIDPVFWKNRVGKANVDEIRFPTEEEKEKKITVNDLNDADVLNYHRFNVWYDAIVNAEIAYMRLIELGAKPEEARSVLPNSLKADICVKMNLREWRHFFKLRTAFAAHPQMREVTQPLLDEFKSLIPLIFDDIEYTA